MHGELKGFVKSADAGSFVAIASMPSVDRDGERILPGAFEPLPKRIPVHAFHRFDDPVGTAVPRYDGDALLVEGRWGSTARAQEIRSMVAEGVLGHVSVGFMGAQKETVDGVPTIKQAELLEVSLVSVPSNRDAAVLVARGYRPGGVAEARRVAAEAKAMLEELDGVELARVDRVLADAEAVLRRVAKQIEPPRPATVLDLWRRQRGDR